MPINKSDFNFYLTSVEPAIAQTIRSQSIGGYPSTSVVYPSTTLSAQASLYGSQFSLTDYTQVSGLEYLLVNSEIVKVSPVASATATITERAVNARLNEHESSDIVRGLTSTLFNKAFNADGKQYRCLAIKNNSASQTAYNVQVYSKQNSRNHSSTIKLALEIPLNDYETGTATGGTKIQLEDSSLIGSFEDNHFENAYLTITSGLNNNQARIISSFDSATGVFVLDSSLPFDIASGSTYKIDPGPAQRVVSGIVAPATGSDRVSKFSYASPSSPLKIDANSVRDHGSDLQPKDVIYVWIERSLVKDSEAFDANSSVISINYLTAP